MEKDEKIEWILCPSCKKLTKHKKVWENKSRYDEDGIWEITDYFLMECLGCETPIIKKEYVFSEDLNINQKGEVEPEITFWPTINFRDIEIKQISNLPINVRKIYYEIIKSYNLKLYTLCSAGIRVIIEAVCKEENILGNDLETKINGLKDKEIITENIKEGLHQNRIIGNEALHEIITFGDFELKTAIELIEILLESHYGSSDKAFLLKNILNTKKEARKKFSETKKDKKAKDISF